MHNIHRKYLIIGTGAIGGYYGAKLQACGLDVRFLLHSDYEEVKRHGLKVQSPQGDIVLPTIHAYRNASEMPAGDVVIVALKATANAALHAILPLITHKNSTIILIQNGLDGEELIASIAPQTHILGGLAFICSTKVGPGLIHHQDLGNIKLGEFTPDRPGSQNDTAAIVRDFRASGIETTIMEDLKLARWQKLVWNIPFSGLSVVLGANTREIVSRADSLTLTRKLMEEVAAAALACGKTIEPAFIETMIKNTTAMVPYYPSLKIDYDSGRPMEIESIFGNSLRAAQACGYTPHRIEMLYHQLRFMASQRGLPVE